MRPIRHCPGSREAPAGGPLPPVAGSRGPRLSGVVGLAGIAWIGCVALGMAILWNYGLSPGDAAAPPERWPEDSGIPRVPGRPALVLLAHPHCPCTRASLGELALLMAQSGGRAQAWVLFVKPKGTAENWDRTDLWSSAAAIPGVSPRRDEDGAEAARFHAVTSGQVILYGADGRLLFSGGITAARGHSGDNPGRDAIVSLLAGGEAERRKTLVFGCPLHEPVRARAGGL